MDVWRQSTTFSVTTQGVMIGTYQKQVTDVGTLGNISVIPSDDGWECSRDVLGVGELISEREQMMEDTTGTGSETSEQPNIKEPQWIVDPVTFGRRVRALRVIDGFDSVTELGHAMFLKTKVSVSDRTLYMIERGEQPPSLDVFVALIVTLRPSEGLAYFAPAFRGDILEQLKKFTAL